MGDRGLGIGGTGLGARAEAWVPHLASLDGPLSLATRIRIAAADKVESALETITGTLLFVLRAGPTLTLWALALGTAWWFARKRLWIKEPR